MEARRAAGLRKALRSRSDLSGLTEVSGGLWFAWRRAGRQRAEQSAGGVGTAPGVMVFCGEGRPPLGPSKTGLIPKVIPVRRGA